MLKKLAIAACLILLASAAVAAEPRTQKQTERPALFGVPLGITLDEVEQLIQKAGKSQYVMSPVHDPFCPGLRCVNLNALLSPTPGPATTAIYLFDDRVYQIVVTMDDVSPVGRDRIRQAMEKKYGAGKVEARAGNGTSAAWTYRRTTPKLNIQADYWSARSLQICYSDPSILEQIDARSNELEEQKKKEAEARLNKPGTNDKVDLVPNL